MTQYSHRFSWELQTNRMAQLLSAKRATAAPLLDLTESNPTRAELAYPATELQDAFRVTRHPGWLIYEPSAAGLPEARDAVARYYAQRGLPVLPEDILLTASTSEAYSYL